MSGGLSTWDAHGDFRAKATMGVALAYLMLLFPFTIYALFHELYVVAMGGTYITVILVINTQLIARGYDHEPMTLYGLVPGGIIFMSLAFRVDANMASIWCFPSILACYCMLSRRKAMVSNMLIIAFAVPMMWSALDTVVSARITASLLAVSLFASILVREIDAQEKRLRYQLDHDPLTGLLNRTSLKRRIEVAINDFQDRFVPATLMAIDLDHFKSVNDRFGHDTGDLVLCEVARLLKRHVANDGSVFRLGGEEFLVLLTLNEEGCACKRAESLRATIAESVILQGHPITVSIGTASLRASDDRESWTRRSDNRLYAAKHGGRNRVVSTGEVDFGHLPGPDVRSDSNTLDTSDASELSDPGVVGG